MVEVEFWLPSSAEEGRAQTRDCAGVVGVVAIPLMSRLFHDRPNHPAAACGRGIPSSTKEGSRVADFRRETRKAANRCRHSLCLSFLCEADAQFPCLGGGECLRSLHQSAGVGSSRPTAPHPEASGFCPSREGIQLLIALHAARSPHHN